MGYVLCRTDKDSFEEYDDKYRTFGRRDVCKLYGFDREDSRLDYISSEHFIIHPQRVDDGISYVLMDISRNGTFLNNVFIAKEQPARLEDKDVIGLPGSRDEDGPVLSLVFRIS